MRAMRLLVMFNLPTGSKAERKSYSEFRKFLIDDGFIMDQYSVYTRVMLGRDSANAHMERLKANLPKAGRITALVLTEKQYENREVLVCTSQYQSEVISPGAQMTLAF